MIRNVLTYLALIVAIILQADYHFVNHDESTLIGSITWVTLALVLHVGGSLKSE